MNASKDSTNHFETTYLQLRQKEQRVLEDEQVVQLPYLTHGHHSNEWKLRAKSAQRFIKHIQSKSKNQTIIEIGCGNGWFTHMISKHTNAQVFGTDINLVELCQAKKIFENQSTRFIEFNLINDPWKHSSPDIIVFNASIQYFPKLNKVIDKSFDLLNANGEIHILDSPFYHNNQLESAKKRSIQYYHQMGIPQMDQFYFHHSIEELKKFNPTFLYKPFRFPINKFIKDSPFPWVCITQPNE